MEPQLPPTHGKKMPALDGLRGLAVLLVMFQHLFHGLPKGERLADDVVFALAGRSWMGVDLFFVLSGFLITGILWDQRGQPDYYRRFYRRRALRILPAYYLLLLIVYVGLPLLGRSAYVADSAGDQVWFWTHLTNLRIAWNGEWYAHHVPNVFWSLAIEEQFYLLWPCVVIALSARGLMRLCLALAAVATGLRLALAWHPDVNWIQSFVLTPTRMDGLVLGAWMAMAVRQGVDVLRSRRVASTLLVGAFLPLAYLTLQRPPGWREMPIQSLRFAFVALFFAALLWLAVTSPQGSPLRRLFTLRPLRFLGKYSYALYLWHGPCDYAVRQLGVPASVPDVAGSRLPAMAVHVLAAGGLSVLVALLSWNLVEKHLLSLKGPEKPSSA